MNFFPTSRIAYLLAFRVPEKSQEPQLVVYKVSPAISVTVKKVLFSVPVIQKINSVFFNWLERFCAFLVLNIVLFFMVKNNYYPKRNR